MLTSESHTVDYEVSIKHNLVTNSPFKQFLGALWPKLSDGLIIGLAPFQYIVLIVCVPYAITGVTLLFPRLTLASFAAQHKVSTVCATLNSAVSALVRGFCAADHADLYTAEVSLIQSSSSISLKLSLLFTLAD